MDPRHRVTPQDERLLEWLAPLPVRCLALLTKVDKLSRAERAPALEQTRRAVADVLLFSSVSREGVIEARRRLAQWLLEARSGSQE